MSPDERRRLTKLRSDIRRLLVVELTDASGSWAVERHLTALLDGRTPDVTDPFEMFREPIAKEADRRIEKLEAVVAALEVIEAREGGDT